MYELFVGTNETIRLCGERGSTVSTVNPLSSSDQPPSVREVVFEAILNENSDEYYFGCDLLKNRG